MKTIVNRCMLCNKELDYTDSFKDHVINDHMMTYSKYYEYVKSVNHVRCNICNNIMHRLTPWFEIYNPCINCTEPKMYFESVLMNIDKVYNILCTNKYIKLFILNSTLRDRLTHFNLLDYCTTLSSINPLEGINLFNIDMKPGRSPYVDVDMFNVVYSKSSYNIDPSELISHNSTYKFSIGDDKYEIRLPEECEYHNNNHYKYNILNRSNNPQSAKKLLLSSGTCVKFYNTNFDKCKSILRILKNDNIVYSVSLSVKELDYMKFYVMSNSSLLRFIFNLLIEVMRHVRLLTDQSFLLSQSIINPKSDTDMLLDWTINNKMMSTGREVINISVL